MSSSSPPSVRELLLDAVRQQAIAEISDGRARAEIYLQSAVGIGEHPQHTEELRKLIDQIVAGGQPSGKSLRENLVKECAEEAGIPANLAAESVSVGTVSYLTERPEGLRQDVLFNFDLRLPDDFSPVNTDGEVSDFYFWPMEKVIAILSGTDEFKFNSGLVIIDFLIRHGFIDADDPDYVEIVDGLHI